MSVFERVRFRDLGAAFSEKIAKAITELWRSDGASKGPGALALMTLPVPSILPRAGIVMQIAWAVGFAKGHGELINRTAKTGGDHPLDLDGWGSG
jgi:hypothetical protein